jgi:hypothetical protein
MAAPSLSSSADCDPKISPVYSHCAKAVPAQDVRRRHDRKSNQPWHSGCAIGVRRTPVAALLCPARYAFGASKRGVYATSFRKRRPRRTGAAHCGRRALVPGNISRTYFHSREEKQEVPIEEPSRGTRGRSQRATCSYAPWRVT